MCYLTSLFHSGKSYSTINVSRSMLSSTLSPIDGTKIGSHPLIIKLLKSCYNLNPPRPKYDATWDPEVIFNYFRRSACNEDLSILALSAKLATLQALASLMRVSELASICRSSVSISSSRVSFQLSKPRKSQHHGPLMVITLPACPDRSICPVSCLGSYIYRTDLTRSEASNGKLLLSTTPPHRSITGSTVGR